MKLWMKIAGLVLAAVLVLASVACLADKGEGEDKPEVSENPAASAEPAKLDTELPAIELGDIKLDVGDVVNAYNSFLSWLSQYGYSAPASDEEVTEYVNMIIDDLISGNLLAWKAKELGIELNDEDLAGVDVTLEENKQSIITDYEAYATEMAAEDPTITDISAYALDMIEQDLNSYYGTDFESYLLDLRENLKTEAIGVKVQEWFTSTLTVTEESGFAWYTKTLEEQKTAFETAPDSYKTQQGQFETGETELPALFVPEGYVRVKLLTIAPEGELDAVHTTNANEMAQLEAEYGKLALDAEPNEVRMEEIRLRYAELKAANDLMYESFAGASRTSAELALAELEGGADFDAVMEKYSTVEYSDVMASTGALMYVGGEDADYDKKIITAVGELMAGGHSGLIEIDGTYYIVYLVNKLESGELGYDEVKDACMNAALLEMQTSEWEKVQATWLEEAKDAATLYPENYANVGR